MSKQSPVSHNSIVGGVDTHKDLHVAAVVDAYDRVLGSDYFPTTRHGYKCMLSWMRTFGEVKRIVNGATSIAASYGIDPFIIGTTLVALGTSAPELATVVIARLRGHDEIGLGTILGSNIFNGMFVVGVASSINPIPIAWTEVSTGLVVGRARGAVLLIIYGLYVFLLMHKATLGCKRAYSDVGM
jgi:hypothetical protein